jgi:hypothetical protein
MTSSVDGSRRPIGAPTSEGLETSSSPLTCAFFDIETTPRTDVLPPSSSLVMEKSLSSSSEHMVPESSSHSSSHSGSGPPDSFKSSINSAVLSMRSKMQEHKYYMKQG